MSLETLRALGRLKQGTMNKLEEAKRKPHTEAQTLLLIHLRELGLDCVPEYRFHSKRKWSFDVACLDRRIGFECNGHFQGKHGAGWSNDAEKMNTAQAMGWRIFVFHNRDVLSGKAKAWVEENLVREVEPA